MDLQSLFILSFYFLCACCLIFLFFFTYNRESFIGFHNFLNYVVYYSNNKLDENSRQSKHKIIYYGKDKGCFKSLSIL